MKYVTYYYSFLVGLVDVTIHPDKESAVQFYRREAKRYFDIQLPHKTETPTTCGFVHSQFGVMSMCLFRKTFPEWKGEREVIGLTKTELHAFGNEEGGVK